MEEKKELLDQDERVVEIELERLRGFVNHPFKVQADSQMIELQESIKKYGILNPLIVRPRQDGTYEIISGHRRKFAAEKIGYRKVPVIIRVLKDDEAVVSMVDSNLQREMISPSEKAFATQKEADKRKKEIEYKQSIGKFEVQKCATLKELTEEYVQIYGHDKWGVSTYSGNVALINNYILPTIGDTKLAGINTHFMEKYYKDLLKMPAVKSTKNPAVDATVPKAKKQEREIWTAEMLMQALEACDNKMLKIAFHLAFTATLRIGEVLGLTWDAMDISEEAIAVNRAYVYINKEVERVSKQAVEELNSKDIIVELGLPDVVFHSLRHISVTYKLKLSGGDIKAVQGDSGHAQADMVTEVYGHILDEDRRKNAELMENAFYNKENLNPQMKEQDEGSSTITVPDGVDAELLIKVLGNLEMAALLTSLAKTIKV
jgi:ParB/RepB/Spo0J family partition protein